MKPTDVNTDKWVADFKQVMHDSEELLQATVGVVGDKAIQVRERLTDTLDRARQTCREMEDRALTKVRAADKAIHEHPYQSIWMGFSLGMLLGVLLTRR